MHQTPIERMGFAYLNAGLMLRCCLDIRSHASKSQDRHYDDKVEPVAAHTSKTQASWTQQYTGVAQPTTIGNPQRLLYSCQDPRTLSIL